MQILTLTSLSEINEDSWEGGSPSAGEGIASSKTPLRARAHA